MLLLCAYIQRRRSIGDEADGSTRSRGYFHSFIDRVRAIHIPMPSMPSFHGPANIIRRLREPLMSGNVVTSGDGVAAPLLLSVAANTVRA